MARSSKLQWIVGIVLIGSLVLFSFHFVYYGHDWNNVHMLAHDGRSWRLGWLIRSKPELAMKRDSMGTTPLHWVNGTSAKKQDSIIQLLIEHGADPNALDDTGSTPLHWAAFGGQMQTVKLLLQAGADPSIKNSNFETPLDSALARGHSEIADLLRKLSSPRPMDNS